MLFERCLKIFFAETLVETAFVGPSLQSWGLFQPWRFCKCAASLLIYIPFVLPSMSDIGLVYASQSPHHFPFSVPVICVVKSDV